jgi:hypothetical protein
VFGVCEVWWFRVLVVCVLARELGLVLLMWCLVLVG